MSEDAKDPTPPPTGLGILFLAAALALGLVLSLVALVAYMAFSPPRTVNPPAVPSTKPTHEGRLVVHASPLFRRT